MSALFAELGINCKMFIIVDYPEFTLLGVSFHSELVLCLLLYWCIYCKCFYCYLRLIKTSEEF